MRVMGIDPGSLCTGYGVVDAVKGNLQAVHWGSIRPPARKPFPDRLKYIYDGLTEVLREYAPDTVAIEDIFFAVNAKSTIKLGQARGVAILAVMNAGKSLAEYSPLEVKQSTVGYGRADKRQVQDMVTALLKLKQKPEPLDVSDALAVAICHAHSYKMTDRLSAALKR